MFYWFCFIYLRDFELGKLISNISLLVSKDFKIKLEFKRLFGKFV